MIFTKVKIWGIIATMEQFFNINSKNLNIEDNFLNSYINQSVNSTLFKQWHFFEKNGYLQNFKNVSENAQTFSGFIFSDMALHIWAQNSFYIAKNYKLDKTTKLSLEKKLKEYVDLVSGAIDNDGYIFTYNQIFFQNCRWENLNVERDLETIAHFIKAAIEHHNWSGNFKLLNLAEKSAELICKTFKGRCGKITFGPPEIESALLQLYKITDNLDYKEMAVEFLKNRGVKKFSGFIYLRELINSYKKKLFVKKNFKIKFIKFQHTILPEELNICFIKILKTFLTGQLYQQNRIFESQKNPCGNVDSWTNLLKVYSELELINLDKKNIKLLEKFWTDMVIKFIYPNGGFGSTPIVDSFEKKFRHYGSTAISSPRSSYNLMVFCQNMFLITRQPKYQDMVEWIFYNAILPSISYKDDKFFNRNILESFSSIKREENFHNPYAITYISKSINLFLNNIFFQDSNDDIYIMQRPSLKWNNSEAKFDLSMEDSFPDKFITKIKLKNRTDQEKTLFIRIPGWAYGFKVLLNKKVIDTVPNIQFEDNSNVPSFFSSLLYPIYLKGKGEKNVEIEFAADVRKIRGDKKSVEAKESVAISYGQLLYCLEDVDNKKIDFGNLSLKSGLKFGKEKSFDFTDCMILTSKNSKDETLTFIPYYLWANRGKSRMATLLKEEKN